MERDACHQPSPALISRPRLFAMQMEVGFLASGSKTSATLTNSALISRSNQIVIATS